MPPTVQKDQDLAWYLYCNARCHSRCWQLRTHTLSFFPFHYIYFLFLFLFFYSGKQKMTFLLWVSQSLMDWLGSISLEFVGLKIPALFEEEEKSLMLNAPLLFQARDMLGQCCHFQNWGTWKKNHSSGKWINSESYVVHIEIGLDFLKAVKIDINSPWLRLVTARLHKNIKRCKGKKKKKRFLNMNLGDSLQGSTCRMQSQKLVFRSISVDGASTRSLDQVLLSFKRVKL